MITLVSSRFHSRAAWLAATAGLILFVFITHTHWIGVLSSHFIGGAQGDGGLYVWLAASFHHFPGIALRGDSHAFYPYPLTRAWSDSFLLPSALTSVLLACGVSLATAYNSIYIAALVSNGLGVMALCRALALAWLPSFVAATAFACSSYLTGNFGHPQLQFFFWAPCAWACVISSREASLRRWYLAGLCVAASFYCAVYYAIFAALGLGLILFLSVHADGRGFMLALLRGGAMGLGALPIAWLLPSYLQVKDTFGSRGLYEADAFAASGLSYLSFPAFNWLFGFTAQWTHTEATLCAGFLVLGVAIVYVARECRSLSILPASVLLVALVTIMGASSVVDAGITSELLTALSGWSILLVVCIHAARNRSPRSTFAALIALFFVLSFGPAGNPNKGEPALAPFALLYSLMPGMDSVRAVSRFGSVVIMGLYVTTALALSTYVREKRWQRISVCILVLGISMLENYTPVFPLDPLPARPEAFDTLNRVAQPHEAALALPFAGDLEKGRVKSWSEYAILNTHYAVWNASLGIPFVNGYSGQRPKLSMELPAAVRSFPSPESFEWLNRICGLRWIIVVPSLFKSWNQAAFEQKLLELGDRLSLVATGTDGSMLIRMAPWTTSSAPIFTPPSSPLLLEFQAPSATGCSATVYELARDKENNVTSHQVQQISLKATGTRVELPPQTNPTGNARLLSVQMPPCATAFRCMPLDPSGLK